MVYPIAYPPIARGFIKEEQPFGDEQEECDQQDPQLVAYSPIPKGTIIKEELEESLEEPNAFNLEGKQV